MTPDRLGAFLYEAISFGAAAAVVVLTLVICAWLV